MDALALRKEAGKSWPDAARAVLAEAGMRRVFGQNKEADNLLGLVRDAVLDPPTGPLSFSYYRLVSEYAAACARLPQQDAKRRLAELLAKLPRIPNTYTTKTHFSRYHLMILEALVLGLTANES
jgi:hypothetical protein